MKKVIEIKIQLEKIENGIVFTENEINISKLTMNEVLILAGYIADKIPQKIVDQAFNEIKKTAGA